MRAQQAKVGQSPGAVSEPGMAKAENGVARVPLKGAPVWLVNGCCNCILLLLGLARARGAHDGAGVHCGTRPSEHGPSPRRVVSPSPRRAPDCARLGSDLPGVFKGPGEGTLKFCGVRAVTGLWEGCGEGLGRKLLGDGAGPELCRAKGSAAMSLGLQAKWGGARARPT